MNGRERWKKSKERAMMSIKQKFRKDYLRSCCPVDYFWGQDVCLCSLCRFPV